MDNDTKKTKLKPRGKPFSKGDPRINRKGRPKDFDTLRELAQRIALERPEKKFTRAERILRDWCDSDDFQKQKSFMEIAYGKVPDKTEISGGATLQIEYVNDWHKSNPTESPPRAA